ncbi:general odorant-binding protein 99a [Pseudomyrmex gracilis]|uniref:general odorant-binding protein 99a n=1 Tax=Pseudomyrmex gracilis TaxID=219809 RepID=UPI0009956095|nr:general odorant-binding protein 99a [Pseudomyrmex gracilis]
MIKNHLILFCVCFAIKLVIVSSEDIDWTTVHDELRKLAGGLRKKCTAETGTTIETLDAVELGDFPDDEKLACYFKCVMEKAGVMKKDGKINYKMLSKMMPAAFRHIGNEMLDECRNIEGKDKCEKAYSFNKCMYNANPVAFFAV